MDPRVIYWLVFIVLSAIIVILNAKYGMLHDDSILEKRKPYSYSRSQLAFWTVIVLTGFVTIIIKTGNIPDLNQNVLILLGLSSVTTVTARLTDVSDKTKLPPSDLTQNMPGKNFIIDIISDSKGVSITRLQAVIFNLVIGFWFISKTMSNIFAYPAIDINLILPDPQMNNLILMGLSSGTYIAMKTTENKSGSGRSVDQSQGKADNAEENNIPPLG